MNNQEILDNAPEGATHYNEGWLLNPYEEYKTTCNIRSLADIKRITELEKERDSLLRLISYVRSIVFSKAKCGYASFKRPLEELLKDQGNG